MGDVIEILADLWSKLYVGTQPELKEVVKKVAPVFDSEGKSRAEVLSVIEKYFVNLDKEPDKGDRELTLISLKKDIKISGNISESANCIEYVSFLHQVESGTAKGYTERDIIDAIIPEIQVGSKLRGYLGRRDDLTLSEYKPSSENFTMRKALLNCIKNYVA